MLALGFRSHTDIPVLKELEEWFDAQKDSGDSKLDPFFERTRKLASGRMKREIKRHETHGEFCARAGSLREDPHGGKRFGSFTE